MERQRQGLHAAAIAGVKDGLAMGGVVALCGLSVAGVVVGARGIAEGRPWEGLLILGVGGHLYWLNILWPHARRAWEWQREYRRARRNR